MASKYSLAERLRKQLQARLSTEAKVSQQQAAIAIGAARNELIQRKVYADYYAERVLSVSNYITEYGYDEPLKPTWDSDRNLYSLKLPAQPIELPNGVGIQEVKRKGETEYAMIRVEPFSGNLYRGMAGANLPRPKYFVKGRTLYFDEESVGDKTEIIVSMVADSAGIGDLDTLPIDPDMELMIITRAKEILLVPNNPEDVLNDNVST